MPRKSRFEDVTQLSPVSWSFCRGLVQEPRKALLSALCTPQPLSESLDKGEGKLLGPSTRDCHVPCSVFFLMFSSFSQISYKGFRNAYLTFKKTRPKPGELSLSYLTIRKKRNRTDTTCTQLLRRPILGLHYFLSVAVGKEIIPEEKEEKGSNMYHLFNY